MTSPPIVLFVGDDASSTQIAESLLQRLVGDRVEIHENWDTDEPSERGIDGLERMRRPATTSTAGSNSSSAG
jgi:hypothetical protein